MNNYDYDFSKDFIKTDDYFFNKLLILNNLQWLNIFLVSFSLFQLFFFIGYTFVSFLIVGINFSIGIRMFLALTKLDKLFLDIEYLQLVKKLEANLCYFLSSLILSVLDFILAYGGFKFFIFSELLESHNPFKHKFIAFTMFLLILRLCLVSLISYLLYFKVKCN